MNNNILKKALCFSYIYGQLQIENLEVAVHELEVVKDVNAARLKDKLVKAISANRNAFRIMERNITKEEVQSLSNDLAKVLEATWEEHSNG